MTEQQPLHISLPDTDQVPELWRNELQARLDRYKRRRGRRIEGAFTMRFPFPPDEPATYAVSSVEHAPVSAVQEPDRVGSEVALAKEESPAGFDTGELTGATTSELDQSTEAESPPQRVDEAQNATAEPKPEEVVPIIELPPRPQPRRKVIAFPSSTYTQQEAMRRLADPVQPEQLRILDVPEELQAIPATPFLEGLLDALPVPAQTKQPDTVDLPFAVVSSSRRIGAALIDTVAVLAAMAVIVGVASCFVSHELPATKFLIAGGLSTSVLLWASYQYLLLVYGGRTLGMKLTRICLYTFKGRGLTFRQRQSRVFALYLSVLSLSMGVLWSFVDIDRLCWHDRISQTFPVPTGKS